MERLGFINRDFLYTIRRIAEFFELKYTILINSSCYSFQVSLSKV